MITRMITNSRAARHISLLCLLGGCFAVPGATKTILIPAQPRPLWQLAVELEKEYKWRVTYEEAPLEYASDLSNGARSGTHLVARPTAFQGSFDDPQDPGSMEEKWKILVKLVRTYSGPHGQMTVLNNGDYSHIVPTTIKKKDGSVVQFEPILSTRVSFAPAMRTLRETVQLIMSQVATARAVSIGLGTIPTNLFVQQSQLTYANDEQARDVLMRIFEDASGARQLTGGTPVRVTWALLHDVSDSAYAFNAHIVDPIVSRSTIKSPGSNPSSSGPLVAPTVGAQH